MVSRREFLKTLLVYAAILSMSNLPVKADKTVELASEHVKRVMKGEEDPVHVIWIQGQSCSGDSVALLNAVDPSIVDVLIGQVQGVPPVELDYHPTLMPQWGVDHISEEAGSLARGWDANKIIDDVIDGKYDPYVLVVEGAIPNETTAQKTGGYWCSIGESRGKTYLMEPYLRLLAARAAAVVAIGTCASFGGIPHGKPNPTSTRGVYDVLGHGWKSSLGVPVVNVPGCPAGGDWQVKAIAHLLLTVKGLLPVPELNKYNMPVFLYGQTTHELCPRGVYFGLGKFSEKYGQPLCMFSLGCKGPISNCPINRTGFVEGVGRCTEYGSVCIGCTMPDFPDEPYAPFLKELPTILLPPTKPKPEVIKTNLTAVGAAAIAGAAVGGGIAYFVGARMGKKPKSEEEEKEGGE